MMHPYGFRSAYLAGPIICLSLVLIWLILGLFALLSLRKQKLTTTAQALWVLIIATVPLAGALAYFIIQPHEAE
jgi:hypothetical protein